MAFAAWATITPTSGSGNGQLSNTATANTGRDLRQTTVTGKGAGVSDQTYILKQSGKPEFVEFNSANISKDGGTVTLSGKSNSSKLTFALGAGDLTVTLPASFLANGVTTNNGVAIAGDPGKTMEYNFAITFESISANLTTAAKTRNVSVTCNGGQSTSATITQSASNPFLTFEQEEVTLAWEGTPAVKVDVSSNINWTIS